MVVTGPEAEHVEDGRVVQLSDHGEPAKFPGVLHEGEITPDKGVEADIKLHHRGGGKKNKTKTFHNGKQNTGKLALLTFCILGSVVLSHFSRV